MQRGRIAIEGIDSQDNKVSKAAWRQETGVGFLTCEISRTARIRVERFLDCQTLIWIPAIGAGRSISTAPI